MQGRLAAAGIHRVDDDLLGDALGFLVINLERGHNLAGSIWRAAAWVAEGRRFVTVHDYRDLLGCESVTYATLTDGRYFGVADRTAQIRDDFGALVDDRQLEPWESVAIAEETDRREDRERSGRSGSVVVGEWLAGVYADAFGVCACGGAFDGGECVQCGIEFERAAFEFGPSDDLPELLLALLESA